MESKTYYLTPYILKVKGEGEELILDSVLGKWDILLELNQYLSVFLEEGRIIDFEDKKRLVRFSEVFLEEEERIVYGIMEYGEYGEEKPIIDKITGAETHNISKNEAPMYPYYFCFFIPNDSRKGVLLVQKIGNKGVRTVIYDVLKDIFSSYPFTIYLNQLVLKKVLDELFSNPIKRIKFIKYTVSRDVANNLGIDWRESQEEKHIVAKKNRILRPLWMENLLEKIASGDKIDFAELIPDEGDSDEIDLVFKLPGSRQRTLKIKKYISLKSDYLLQNLEFGRNGHPTLDSLHREALYLLDVIRGTVFGIEG